MLLHNVLVCGLLLLGILSLAEARRVCKDHSRHCRQIGDKRPRFRCYRKSTQERCCATCRKFENPHTPECLYGDKLAWCSSIGQRYEAVSCYTHEVECCETCGRLASDEIKDCPYGNREIWCPYFTRERCKDPAARSSCCETCHRLLHGDSSSTSTDKSSERPTVPTSTAHVMTKVSFNATVASVASTRTSNSSSSTSVDSSTISRPASSSTADTARAKVTENQLTASPAATNVPDTKPGDGISDDDQPTSPRSSLSSSPTAASGISGTALRTVGTTPLNNSRTANETLASNVSMSEIAGNKNGQGSLGHGSQEESSHFLSSTPPVVAANEQSSTRTETSTVAGEESGRTKLTDSVTSTPATITYRSGLPGATPARDGPTTLAPFFSSRPTSSASKASTTVSTATEIHIKLRDTPPSTARARGSDSNQPSSSSPSVGPPSSSSSSYHQSLEDDEDYALEASGEGDGDITIDNIVGEGGGHQGGRGHHRDHHHNGAGGGAGGNHHGGGHHHKKGHHKNGVTQEVPYRYIPAEREDYIFDDFRSSSCRPIPPGGQFWSYARGLPVAWAIISGFFSWLLT